MISQQAKNSIWNKILMSGLDESYGQPTLPALPSFDASRGIVEQMPGMQLNFVEGIGALNSKKQPNPKAKSKVTPNISEKEFYTVSNPMSYVKTSKASVDPETGLVTPESSEELRLIKDKTGTVHGYTEAEYQTILSQMGKDKYDYSQAAFMPDKYISMVRPAAPASNGATPTSPGTTNSATKPGAAAPTTIQGNGYSVSAPFGAPKDGSVPVIFTQNDPNYEANLAAYNAVEAEKRAAYDKEVAETNRMQIEAATHNNRVDSDPGSPFVANERGSLTSTMHRIPPPDPRPYIPGPPPERKDKMDIANWSATSRQPSGPQQKREVWLPYFGPDGGIHTGNILSNKQQDPLSQFEYVLANPTKATGLGAAHVVWKDRGNTFNKKDGTKRFYFKQIGSSDQYETVVQEMTYAEQLNSAIQMIARHEQYKAIGTQKEVDADNALANAPNSKYVPTKLFIEKIIKNKDGKEIKVLTPNTRAFYTKDPDTGALIPINSNLGIVNNIVGSAQGAILQGGYKNITGLNAYADSRGDNKATPIEQMVLKNVIGAYRPDPGVVDMEELKNKFIGDGTADYVRNWINLSNK